MKKPFLMGILTLVISSYALASDSPGRIAVKNYREIYASLLQLLNVPTDGNIKYMFSRVQKDLPAQGLLEQVNDGTWRALNNLAYPICNKRTQLEVTQPAADRLLNKEVNFSLAGQAITGEVRDRLVGIYVSRFWQRSATAEEHKLLREKLDVLLDPALGNLIVSTALNIFCVEVFTTMQFLES